MTKLDHAFGLIGATAIIIALCMMVR